MIEEHEVKYLDINPDQIEAKLKDIGAQKIFDRIFKIKVFDYPDLRLNEVGAWIRLRDEGDKITLTFKKRLGIKEHGGQTNDEGMEEYETTVGDFDNTANIFLKSGFIQKFYEEKRRVRYMKDNIEFDIDYCPGLKPYLEIEAPSWENVDEAIKLLALNPQDKKIFSTFQIYELSGIKMLDYKELSFKGLIKREAGE